MDDRAHRSAPAAWQTEQLEVPERPIRRLALSIGRGPEARRHLLRDTPLHVGSGPGNEIVLVDSTVSARHLRMERLPDGALVRDLDSSNGTWIGGLRVTTARIGPGAQIRVGRTDLVLLGDAIEPAGGLVVASPEMQRLLGEVRGRLARVSWPVLVCGASGAGKEGIARALHAAGPRAGGPFVALNAGGFPRQLIESELFGHELGAFTGAVRAHRGVFEQAHGGTLFLDEIGELPLDLQARLLRVVDTWEVRRIGSERSMEVDARLVCATHRDLRAMVADGAFREDLYYRLAQLVVEVPPLRERPEDIRALSERFLVEMEVDVGVRRLTEDACQRLLRHSWPGNVRELRNVLACAAATTPVETLGAYDVEAALARVGGLDRAAEGDDEICAAVELHGGNLTAAARTLGIPRSTLRDRLKGLARTGAGPQRIKRPA